MSAGSARAGPSAAGPNSAALAQAVRLVESRRCAAQLCVRKDGAVVLDHAFGCEQDSLFFLFSASKPYVALLVHMLAERGYLSLDVPVARYWPEFGQHGKDAVTIREVLQHRSGLPVARSFALDALEMTDWAASVRRLEKASLRYPPGQVPAYHVLSYGFVLGELIQRVTGTPLRDFLGTELLGPLGLHDTHLGMPDELWRRRVPVDGRGLAEAATQCMVNRRTTRQAVIPAASVSATARDLARFYQMLLNGGQLDGVRVLQPQTIVSALRPSSDGEVDRYLKLPIRWSEGFQLGGARDASVRLGGGPGPMGRLARRTTFGHNGSYVCIGWADPERNVAVGYVTARLVSRAAGAQHMADVSDAIVAACETR